MERLRIIFSSYDSLGNPYYGGGGAVAVHEVAKRIAMRHDVTVICGSFPEAKDSVLDGVRYRHIGGFRLGPRLSQLFYHGLLLRALRSTDFDVWVESFTPPFSTSFLPCFTKKPVIGLCHLLSGRNMTRKYGGMPFYRIEALGMRHYHHVIALTEHARDQIESLNEKVQCHIIPNGIDPAFLDCERDLESDPYFLFLGRIAVHQKGLDTLMESLMKVKDRLPWKVVLAGAGSPKDESWLRKKAIGLESLVEIVGPVHGQKKFDLMSRCGAMLMPSRYETLPLSILEGFALGKPLLWFEIPQLNWIPKNCGLAVPPENVEEYGEAMIDMANSLEGRMEWGRKARSFSRQFDWDRIANEYEKLIVRIHDEETNS